MLEHMRQVLRIVLGIGFLFSLALAWFTFGVSASLKEYLPDSSTDLPANTFHGLIRTVPASELRLLLPAVAVSVRDPSVQLGRTLTCASGPQNNLSRELQEMRTAAQIRLRYSREEQGVALLNISYFGEEQFGSAAGAQHYFGLAPSQLSIGQAAELVALRTSPSLYSPTKHPDRALASRNVILCKEYKAKAISKEQWELGTIAPLGK